MNAESVNRCPKCQASVPAEAPQGLCPKCLLASAAAPTEVGQAAEAAPPPTLQAVGGLVSPIGDPGVRGARRHGDGL